MRLSNHRVELNFFSYGSLVGSFADESGLEVPPDLTLQLEPTGGNSLQLVARQSTSDITPPTVLQIVPADGATGNRTQDIQLSFSERMNPSTLVENNFTLVGPSGPTTADQFLVTDLGSGVRFNFDSLPVGDYALTIAAASVTDRAGNPLGASDITYNFSIAAMTATWIASGGGNWDDAANWQDGRIPQDGDDVVINVPANATVTYRSGSVLINSLTTSGKLNLTGGRLDVLDTVQVDGGITIDGGTLAGATVVGSGNVAVTGNMNNVLDGVTLNVDISLPDTYDFLRIENGLELNGTMTLGYYTRVMFRGTQSLSGTGEIVLSNTSTAYYTGLFPEQSYTTLTIDDGITVRGGNGTIGRSSAFNTASNVNVVNRGTIDADTSGRSIQITPAGGTFINEGTLRSSGGTLDVDGLIGNAGSINPVSGTVDLDGDYVLDQDVAISGAALTLRGTWDNQASLSATGGSVVLNGTPADLGVFSLDATHLYVDGTLTTSQLDQLNLNKVTLTVRGTLENTGETLAIGDGTRINSLNLDGGTIRGGTVSGEKTGGWSAGQLGGGVQLDNTSYLSVPHSESVDPRRQVTIETWIYVDAFDSTWQAIIEKGDGNVSTDSYRLLLNSNGHLQFLSSDSSGYQYISTPSGVIQRGQWHHVAGVIDRDAGQLRIYVDGTPQATGAIRTGDIYSHTTPLLLGGSLEGFDRFSGRMDEVRIWDRARSETEIQANQNQMLVGNEPGLAGYWRFEETAGLLAANEVAGGDAAEWQDLPDLIQVTSNTNNHLDGVTLDADLSLSDTSDFVRVSNGLELNARATIGPYARLQFDGTQTLGGDGEVVFSTSNATDRQGILLGQSYTTLTIDDGITVRGGNGTIGRSSYVQHWPVTSTSSTMARSMRTRRDGRFRSIPPVARSPMKGRFVPRAARSMSMG